MSESNARGLALHWRILIGLAVGAIAGLVCKQWLGDHPGLKWFSENIANTVGQVFLRLIFMVVIPLVFCALTLGVAEIGDVRKLGRLGLMTFLMTLLFSGASVVIGLGLANTLKPGTSLSDESRERLKEQFTSDADDKIKKAGSSKGIIATLLEIIPRNPLQEAVGALDGSSPGSGLLGVMFFSLCMGVALTTIGDKAKPVLAVLEGFYEAIMAIIRTAMSLAPYGVAGLVFYATTLLGFDIIRLLAGYVVAVILGLSIHMFVVYSIAIWVIAKRNPLTFFRDILEVLVTAFGTSSSSATLPTSIRVVDENLKLNRKISHFVLTIGSTANQNGTALYEGITVLFLAQVFGVELSLSQQIIVVLLSMLAGIGTAGVPGGSLPLVVLVLQSVGVPPEGIAIIMGVDRLLDMSRTTVNVCGDVAVAVCVDAIEGKRMESHSDAITAS
ncbi:Proton/sodium-glutamate symport protein [Pirellula sp. SH-Sr6A]|uniref:dicarboxylate/amino acid:cation symporter n=1 Tax=Pirellula sp. SH-Sr6A TaxID=1632865 RepID=UPI00078DF732|nr:dicarboxylate/amino acid:cation symporter [Pirellula sp. SH-Sr6A]AMV33459.1 Proton/sodium-glutamate symport protein [Pirellula sp. SH-Sr6A]